eukprot:gnl/MRDRNA2_/MRDRNA2_111267_c0_seq1.p1 gnl/MRDRNA2_/MRDRNA2_111267_c0~~gnl/MRDRNA2_/MRDRNA2_111267_c0_seq1.p1  ORF type:complete len:229 (+),score=61.58 gnl/MRDRNA2_/MRDRNA2_111267_c0_seq1:38-688(+)
MTPYAINEIKKLFKHADLNKDGVVDKDEMKAVFKALGEWEENNLDKLFSSIDANGDGKIQIDEFLTWLLDDIKDPKAEEPSVQEGLPKVTQEGFAKVQALSRNVDSVLEEEAKAKDQLRLAEIHTTMEATMNKKFGSKADFKLERVGPIGNEDTYFRVSWSGKTGKTQNRYVYALLKLGDPSYYQRKKEEDVIGKELQGVYPHFDFEEMLEDTPNL